LDDPAIAVLADSQEGQDTREGSHGDCAESLDLIVMGTKPLEHAIGNLWHY
jgi:hypothetical protein